MEFSPSNNVVKLCLQALNAKEVGNQEEANKLFIQAWNESIYDFEKYISAHYISQIQNNSADQLNWLKITLQFALKINKDAVASALPPLYSSIAKCYDDEYDYQNAKKSREIALTILDKPTDKGPFYHGTKANLQVGDFLTTGFNSNYDSTLKMNHIYFTALLSGAGLAAALAQGDGPARVYQVETTGEFENDPNVTNKKFPGNMTRSYRSSAPIKIVAEVFDWARQTPSEIQKWREKIAINKGDIIN